MRTTINAYAKKIEDIFYLIKNEDLTQYQKNVKIKNVLTELQDQAIEHGYRMPRLIVKSNKNN